MMIFHMNSTVVLVYKYTIPFITLYIYSMALILLLYIETTFPDLMIVIMRAMMNVVRMMRLRMSWD